MSNISMSATRMSTFLQCKRKYWCNYVLRRPRKPNPAFKLGTSVHGALELAGRIWSKKEKFTKHDIKNIKDMYLKIAAQESMDNMVIYEEGLAMISNRLNDFDLGKIISIEDKFNIITDDGVPLIGAMDKVIEINEETLLVVDYKTSKYFYTKEELMSDIQLSMYDLVASIKYPEYKKIILSLDYLRDAPVYTYRTFRSRQLFSKYVLAIYEQMLGFVEDDAIPEINNMCNWCDFSDDCPAYVDINKGKNVIKKNFEDLTPDELVEEVINVRSKKRILDEYEKQLKQFVMRKIEATGEDLVGSGRMLYIKQNKRSSYNVRSLYNNMPLNDFLKSVNASNRDVSEFISSNPDKKSDIMDSMTVDYTSPFLGDRKVN